MRVLTEKLAAVDPQGKRHIIIKTRTFETIKTLISSEEMEKLPSFSLPGLGAVNQTSDTEFQIVRTGTPLRLV